MPPTPPTPAILTYPTPPKPKPLSQNPLEQVIGIKWAGWIGAVVLVIGAALGIKYAYDQGLFPTISPTARLILMSLGAFGLIGIGEYVFRKVGRLSATGFFGAGVACLFIISYAGHGYYDLYARDTAFTFMGIATLVGAAVAMRGGLVSIAVLSLIGGNLAPAILRGDTSRLVPFLSYLLMLQVVALVLAYWGRSEKWWTLRGLSLASTGFWILALLLRGVIQPWSAGMWFILTYATLYQAEVILSATRRALTASDEGSEPPTEPSLHPTQNIGAIFSIITTTLLSAAILAIFWRQAPAVRGTWFATFSAITLLLSIVLARTAKPIAISFRIQAAALVLLSVPVTFTGAPLSFGWAILALALAAAGMLLNDRTARLTAAISWVLALMYLIIWTSNHPNDAKATWLTLFNHPLSAMSCIAGILAMAGHAVAVLAGWPSAIATEKQKDEVIALGRALSWTSTAVFAAATILALPPLGATITLLVYAWLLVLADYRLGRLMPLAQGCAVLVFVTAKWAAVDVIAARLNPAWNANAYAPVFNPLMGTAVAIAGSLVAIYRLRRESLSRMLGAIIDKDASAALISLGIIASLMTFGLSFEVDRVVERMSQNTWPQSQLKLMGLTILWSICSAAYFAAYAAIDHTSTKRSTFRAFAWTISLLLAAKFFIFDTLFWVITAKTVQAPAAILNIQMLTAMVIVGMLGLTHWLLSRAARQDAAQGADRSLGHRVAFLATLVILWAGTFEIARLVSSGVFPGATVWNDFTLKNLAWTSWWTIGLTGFLAFATRLGSAETVRHGELRAIAALPALIAVKFLTVDTFLAAITASSPTVMTNAQAATAAIVFAALIFLRHILPAGSRVRTFVSAVAVLIPLWIGTIEINRAFERSPALAAAFADPHLAKQVAFSIFFSIYAIACVALGFRIRAAALRYFGLALFALTLVKVGVLDLSKASTGYRFLSFMGLGALLMITSVLYGRLSPKLLRAGEPAADPD